MARSARAIDPSMISTNPSIEGYRILKSLGVVRGVTVRSRSIFGTIGAAFQTIAGGDISLLTDLCERTRAQAHESMLAHAAEVNANAVLGVRYDATEIMSGVTEVLCYGTAAVLEPVRESSVRPSV